MPALEYHKVSLEDIEKLGSKFCDEHGDGPDGTIPDSEYDRLFDHLADMLRVYGTFVEGSGDADFSGYRYVDQVPWIAIVPGDVSPSVALSAGLMALSSSHRPIPQQLSRANSSISAIWILALGVNEPIWIELFFTGLSITPKDPIALSKLRETPGVQINLYAPHAYRCMSINKRQLKFRQNGAG
ncbi:hypothetical protein BH11VER1_BH11VER1_05860 [soil metagenome]